MPWDGSSHPSNIRPVENFHLGGLSELNLRHDCIRGGGGLDPMYSFMDIIPKIYDT